MTLSTAKGHELAAYFRVWPEDQIRKDGCSKGFFQPSAHLLNCFKKPRWRKPPGLLYFQEEFIAGP